MPASRDAQTPLKGIPGTVAAQDQRADLPSRLTSSADPAKLKYPSFAHMGGARGLRSAGDGSVRPEAPALLEWSAEMFAQSGREFRGGGLVWPPQLATWTPETTSVDGFVGDPVDAPRLAWYPRACHAACPCSTIRHGRSNGVPRPQAGIESQAAVRPEKLDTCRRPPWPPCCRAGCPRGRWTTGS